MILVTKIVLIITTNLVTLHDEKNLAYLIY